jgi:hypothetical protein
VRTYSGSLLAAVLLLGSAACTETVIQQVDRNATNGDAEAAGGKGGSSAASGGTTGGTTTGGAVGFGGHAAAAGSRASDAGLVDGGKGHHDGGRPDAGPPEGGRSDGSSVTTDASVNVPACGASRTAVACDAGLCVPTTPEPIVPGILSAFSLVLDPTFVYYSTAFPTKTVSRVPKTGGTVDPIVPSEGGGPVAVDDTHVFYGTDTELVRASLTGGDRTPLDTIQYGLDRIAVDETRVYYSVANVGMYSIDKNGGTAQPLAPDVIVGGLAVDSTQVYWASQENVSRMPKHGGKPTSVGRGDWGSIAIDNEFVYWTTMTDLRRGPKTGGLVGIVADIASITGRELTVDACHVYWAVWDGRTGYLYRVPRDGGAIELVTSIPHPIMSIALDQDFAYFCTENGPLYRLHK